MWLLPPSHSGALRQLLSAAAALLKELGCAVSVVHVVSVGPTTDCGSRGRQASGSVRR